MKFKSLDDYLNQRKKGEPAPNQGKLDRVKKAMLAGRRKTPADSLNPYSKMIGQGSKFGSGSPIGRGARI